MKKDEKKEQEEKVDLNEMNTDELEDVVGGSLLGGGGRCTLAWCRSLEAYNVFEAGRTLDAR